MLKFSVGNIRRELIKLKNTGLFLSEDKGNLVYYYLNQSHPLFEELKSIISKTSGASKMLHNILEKFEGINQAFIMVLLPKEKREKIYQFNNLVTFNRKFIRSEESQTGGLRI